jgi:hypothetical protein
MNIKKQRGEAGVMMLLTMIFIFSILIYADEQKNFTVAYLEVACEMTPEQSENFYDEDHSKAIAMRDTGRICPKNSPVNDPNRKADAELAQFMQILKQITQ